MIFIRYTNFTKYLSVWALKTYQVLMASKLVINGSKQGAELLVENLLPPSAKLFNNQLANQNCKKG